VVPVRQMNRFLAREVSAFFLLCVPAILYSPCAQAKFLKDAETRPRGRIACLASSTIGTRYPNPKRLGTHGYRINASERNGIVYTCKAGHIDITHVRKLADWTAYLAAEVREKLRSGETEFSFKFKEPSRFFVHLTYPEDWQDRPGQEKERIIHDISIRLGQYFAHTEGIWHEILTWFGYKSAGFIPEFPSAFSWEDSFSDLLGTYVGAIALRDPEHEFCEAVTLALNRELEKLAVQPRRTAIRAANQVRGRWFSGDLITISMKKRNFDVGLDDGFITPWIVPSVRGCEAAQAQPYPVGNLDFLSKYGFSLHLEIEPRELEKGKILSAVYPDKNAREDRVVPAVHFAKIMDHIRNDAIEKYGPDVDSYYCGTTGNGDLNGDCRIDMRDFARLTSDWLQDGEL